MFCTGFNVHVYERVYVRERERETAEGHLFDVSLALLCSWTAEKISRESKIFGVFLVLLWSLVIKLYWVRR